MIWADTNYEELKAIVKKVNASSISFIAMKKQDVDIFNLSTMGKPSKYIYLSPQPQ